MSLQLTWEIEGATELSRRLNFIGAGLSDWTPAFKRTANYLRSFAMSEVFETEGAVYGNKWAPLNPAYEAFKAQKYPGKGILERTGKMRRGFVRDYGPDFAMVGNTVPYFRYHQSRKDRTSNLPRRVMLKLDSERKEMIVKIFQEEYFKKLRQ